ncbi:MAG: bifunctional biotin--[acetyl-CoA-carboxylase] ligase/biotin operon repressor BirA [Cellvibrionaceae bacterium]|nr:bifunctional biotin--[acetyl-CoA-carboxylase] ligase/biotin operon repressor BirA [Cellvibrionaceae bacterium]
MKPAIWSLVTLLADGEFHSGEVIGRALNISRSAVWKQLHKLADYGLLVESVKGKGYRLPAPVELLARAHIVEQLTPKAKALLGDIQLLQTVDSTNTYVLNRIAQGCATKGYVCLAELQTGGRGRRGRQWLSPFGNLTFSLAWEFDEGAAALEGLSLAVGVAVVKSLNDLGIMGIQLKWPNDILYEGAKLGGILIEIAGDPTGRCSVVVGVGLNMAFVQGSVAIEQPYIALAQFSSVCSRNALIAQLLNHLLPMVADFATTGFSCYRDDFQAVDAYRGRPVCVLSGRQRRVGVARGVTEMGALKLELDSGEHLIVHGGEISLRALG